MTIFTAPKPFTNPHIDIIQRNALATWTRLKDVEVILIGDEPGIPEAAKEFGVMNVAQVERDEKGIPLVSAVMEIGHAHSESPLLCYANADMLLMTDLVEAAQQVSKQVNDFLLVSQRWDLDLSGPIDLSGDWEARLRREVEQRGKFFSPWGIDYFIFPRHLYTSVPNFTIGRVAWDNWMVYHAMTTWGLAVDATRSVTVVHQMHDYSHLPGNKPSHGSEAGKSNLAKAGGRRCIYNILDTNRELIAGHIRHPKFHLARLLRRLEWMFITDDLGSRRAQIGFRLQKMQRPLVLRPRR
ncbi:MAG TPA: hypothetical protein VII93_14915 [Anaerolineales bacterium]